MGGYTEMFFPLNSTLKNVHGQREEERGVFQKTPEKKKFGKRKGESDGIFCGYGQKSKG